MLRADSFEFSCVATRLGFVCGNVKAEHGGPHGEGEKRKKVTSRGYGEAEKEDAETRSKREPPPRVGNQRPPRFSPILGDGTGIKARLAAPLSMFFNGVSKGEIQIVPFFSGYGHTCVYRWKRKRASSGINESISAQNGWSFPSL